MSLIDNFPKIQFDFGAIELLGDELAILNVDRPMLVTDAGVRESGVFDMVQNALPGNMKFAVYDGVRENGAMDDLDGAMALYREEGCNGVVAVGGGAVIGAARAIRILATHPGKIDDYRGHSEKITPDVAPCITIPTTAGTGSELTPHGGGIDSPYLKPNVAICDPDLTMTLPPHLTAGTGMDALGHCIEGYVANSVNPPTRAIALDGIRRVSQYIERAVGDGSDRDARWNMLMAASQGGMAIYLGLGPVHAMSHVYDPTLHHGTMVGMLIPPVIRFYQGQIDDKLDDIAAAMGLPDGANLADAIADLNQRIGIPDNVKALGCDNDDVKGMTERALGSQFNKTAPVVPTQEQYGEIISSMLG